LIVYVCAVSNILVQQNCKCVSPLQCECAGDGGVHYKLGDLSLMCMEGEIIEKAWEWEKMLQHAPPSNMGKIAPEVIHDIDKYMTYIDIHMCSCFKKPTKENILAITNLMYIQLV